jgi:hypothetical protein
LESVAAASFAWVITVIRSPTVRGAPSGPA